MLFSIIYGIIRPIDFHIFQMGGATTNQQLSYWYLLVGLSPGCFPTRALICYVCWSSVQETLGVTLHQFSDICFWCFKSSILQHVGDVCPNSDMKADTDIFIDVCTDQAGSGKSVKPPCGMQPSGASRQSNVLRLCCRSYPGHCVDQAVSVTGDPNPDLLKFSGNSIWLVVWSMNSIFPYFGNNNPDWLIFFTGVWNHQPV
jgi:hypothetical protein